MKIYLNEQLLDVTLENEKNLLEVYNQINTWLKKEDKCILSFLVDNQNMEVSNLENISIKEVKVFDITAGKEVDLLKKSLEELGDYLQRMHDNLKNKTSLTSEEKNNITEGFTWILEVISYCQKKLNININHFYIVSYDKSLQDLLNEMKDETSDTESFIQNFCFNLLNLKLFQEDLLYRVSLIDLDLEELGDIILSFCKFIPAFQSELEKVNENLQTGKDNVAISLFNHSVVRLNIILTTLISIESKFSFLKIKDIVLDDVSFEEFFKNINETLTSIATAFESEDIIEAGDLIEYELSENLEVFGKYLLKIEQKLKSEFKKSKI